MSISQNDQQTFIELSTVLTGFSEFHVRGTGQGQLYLKTLVDIVGDEIVEELLTVFRQVKSKAQGDEEMLVHLIRKELLSDEKLGDITRSLIKMWFVGTWYQLPASWRDQYGAREKDVTFVVSPISYTEGLLWTTIGANPSGAKAPGYGSWSSPPKIPEI